MKLQREGEKGGVPILIHASENTTCLSVFILFCG